MPEKLISALLSQLEMTSTPSMLDCAFTCDEDRPVTYAGGYDAKKVLNLTWENLACGFVKSTSIWKLAWKLRDGMMAIQHRLKLSLWNLTKIS